MARLVVLFGSGWDIVARLVIFFGFGWAYSDLDSGFIWLSLWLGIS